MQVINGFINVNTETEGTCLSTKCGEIRTNNKRMSFEIYNNFNESIFCTTIINGKIERTKINSKQGHIIVFVTNCTEIRIYFGNPYGFTSLWGVNYEGNNHVLDLFYMTKSNYINVPNEK